MPLEVRIEPEYQQLQWNIGNVDYQLTKYIIGNYATTESESETKHCVGQPKKEFFPKATMC